MPYLLHEYPMALLAPNNHPRMKYEKTQINNLFESIQDEDVPYSIVVETITAEETGNMFQRLFYTGPTLTRTPPLPYLTMGM